jgi:hypothetical protein
MLKIYQSRAAHLRGAAHGRTQAQAPGVRLGGAAMEAPLSPRTAIRCSSTAPPAAPGWLDRPYRPANQRPLSQPPSQPTNQPTNYGVNLPTVVSDMDGSNPPTVVSRPQITAQTIDKLPQRDPTLVACAFRRQRLYTFSRREPADSEDPALGRDIFNEKPSAEDMMTAEGGSVGVGWGRSGSVGAVGTVGRGRVARFRRAAGMAGRASGELEACLRAPARRTRPWGATSSTKSRAQRT